MGWWVAWMVVSEPARVVFTVVRPSGEVWAERALSQRELHELLQELGSDAPRLLSQAFEQLRSGLPGSSGGAAEPRLLELLEVALPREEGPPLAP
jgi:hypothetical protein